MNDLVEGCRIEGEILLDGKNLFEDIDVNILRKRVGMVFQKPNPFPMSIYDYDRNTALETLKLIMSVGFEIRRK